MPPAKRFRAAAAAARGVIAPAESGAAPTAPSTYEYDDAILERDLGAAAARLLTREARSAPAAAARADEFATALPERRGGKMALHNGRFLRRTIADTEAHNRRLARGAAPPAPPGPPPGPPPPPRRGPRSPSRSPSRSRSRSPSSDGRGRGRPVVEIVLAEDRATGILFERHASGRPVVLGFAASCRASVADALKPGMLLERIAGVKCKAIDYDRSLELVRALEKPLTLAFRLPRAARERRRRRRRRRRSPSSSPDDRSRGRRKKEKRKRGKPPRPS